MTAQTIKELGALLVILGFLWTIQSDISDMRQSFTADLSDMRQSVAADLNDLRKDIGELRERIARVEGAFNILAVRSGQADTAADPDSL